MDLSGIRILLAPALAHVELSDCLKTVRILLYMKIWSTPIASWISYNPESVEPQYGSKMRQGNLAGTTGKYGVQLGLYVTD